MKRGAPTPPVANSPGPPAESAASDASRLANSPSAAPRALSEEKTVAATARLETLVASYLHAPRPISEEQRCLARAVYHEAANQELKGQLAVAQVVLNRVKSGVFPRDVCGVVNQPGQFFNIANFNVKETSRHWLTAVGVALAAETEQVGQAVPGALFFHATSVHPPWGTHTLVAQIGGHLFYR
jgi:spore germination cell wall hydrolase CwlJ-like protein